MRASPLPGVLLAVALCWLVAAGPAQGAGAFQQFDISLVAFDPGIPEDRLVQKAQGIFPDVRRAEASYLPYVLRQALVKSDNWGVVRVLPGPDPSAELMVTGTILRSDGMVLEIALKALDCTGRVWLDGTYKGTTAAQDFSNTRDKSKPLFDSLFRQFEYDLHTKAAELGEQEIARIGQVSMILYAASLVPDAYAGYLARNAQGTWDLRRLPATNDPLMERIERVREHEYLFVDTVDEQYARLYDSMTPSYDLWRKLSREQFSFDDSRTDNLKGKHTRRLDAYESMQRSYNAYKRSKNEQLEVALLATGLNNELSPTLIEVEGRLVSLDGTLQERYQEFRSILRRMYELETGAAH